MDGWIWFVMWRCHLEVISVKLPQITTVPSAPPAPPAPGPRCNLDQDLTFHLVFVSISLNVVRFIYSNCWTVYLFHCQNTNIKFSVFNREGAELCILTLRSHNRPGLNYCLQLKYWSLKFLIFWVVSSGQLWSHSSSQSASVWWEKTGDRTGGRCRT